MKTLTGNSARGLMAILAGLILAACSSADIDALKREHADTEASLAEARAQLEEGSGQAEMLRDAQGQVERLTERLGNAEHQSLSSQEQLQQMTAQAADLTSQLKQARDQLGQAQTQLGAARSDLQAVRAALERTQAWCQFARDVYDQGLNYVSPVSYSRYPEGTGLRAVDCAAERAATPTDCGLAARLNLRTIQTLTFFLNQNPRSPLAVAADQSLQVFNKLQEAIRRACS